MASIDKRPNGDYRARWREYPGGPQRTKHFARKIDAERHLVEVQHQLASGTYIARDKLNTTVAEFGAIHRARQPWRATTAETARRAFVHIDAGLGPMPLTSVRKGDVQAFVAKLSASPGYKRLVMQHLTALFSAALDDGLVARNPCRGVRVEASAKGEIVPPTVEQVAAIHDAAPDWFKPAVILGAGLGLRQAEASGLTVDRIDWLGRSVRVDRQWITRGEPRFSPPKTAASIRSVPAGDFVLRQLGAHVGQRHTGHVLHRDGQPVDHQIFGHYWRKARKAAGADSVRFHDLRHAFASMLISAGCSVKAVSAALGHSSAAVTLGVYSHLWANDEDRIRDAVDAGFLGSAEDQVRTSEGTG
jgi:integrase